MKPVLPSNLLGSPSMSQPSVDLAFPIVEGRTVTIDHGHQLYGAVKTAAPALGEVPLGLHPLRGQPLDGGLLLLRPGSFLRLRLGADNLAKALPLAGREIRVGSMLLRLGAPRIEALEPHPTVYARTVVLVKKDPASPDRGRPATGPELTAALQAIVGPTASIHLLRTRSIRIHGQQILGFEVVVEDLTPEASLRLQAEGLGGRRAFGCGIFVNAGDRKPVAATTPTVTEEGIGHA
jgi:CRISPR-associated protein Cas6